MKWTIARGALLVAASLTACISGTSQPFRDSTGVQMPTNSPTPSGSPTPNPQNPNAAPPATAASGYTVIGRTLPLDSTDPNHFQFGWEGWPLASISQATTSPQI